MSDPDDRWHRLAPRSVAAVGVVVALPLLPTVALMTVSGADTLMLLGTVGIWLVVAAVVCASTAVSWYFTWYRITEQRFELRVGNLSRSHRSIPRERIRSVDLIAQPVHRLLGLSVVRIRTGQHSGDDSEAKLDAVLAGQAELLRRELLRHAVPHAPDVGGPGTGLASTEITRLRPAWLGYSALTVSLALAVWGGLVSGFGSLWETLVSLGLVSRAGELFLATPIWVGVAGAVLALLAVGAAGALVLSTEMWWAFRLTREPDRTLRVRRGLLTTRSVSLDERRLRGVELVEPVLLRWTAGARLNAVATGLTPDQNGKRSDRKALLPPAPRTEAHRVAGAVLRTAWPTRGVARLAGHPPAALRRRLLWSLAAPCTLVAGLAVTANVTALVPWWAWIPALVAPASAAAFAVDAYRALGHGHDDRYLVTRCGTGVRRTVALERGAVIGWRIRRSPFQRRAGLATVSATTAAGSGCYEVRDVGVDEGLVFADDAVPGLLAPFLVHSGTRPDRERDTP